MKHHLYISQIARNKFKDYDLSDISSKCNLNSFVSTTHTHTHTYTHTHTHTHTHTQRVCVDDECCLMTHWHNLCHPMSYVFVCVCVCTWIIHVRSRKYLLQKGQTCF